MFTVQFWIVFALCILVSLGVSLAYGRRAIHPRLRPHFGQVVVVFLFLALASFFIAVVLGKLIGGGMEKLDPKKIEERKREMAQPQAPVPSPVPPASQEPSN